MTVDVHILNKRLDLYAGINYSLTRQVNEFTNLVTREFNYTNRYTVPKTAHNKKIMNFLSYAGNISEAPYIRIEGSSVTFNGIPVVQNGYAIIKETTQDYSIVIYEGSVTFYESIKELTLRNLDWTDSDHLYDENTMEDSWDLTENYVYPIMKTTEQQYANLVPVSHPAPFVFVKDVFDKIANLAGVTFSGSLLSDATFQGMVIGATKSVFLPTSISETPDAEQSKFYNYTSQTSVIETDLVTVNPANGYYKLVLDWNYSSTTGTNPNVLILVNGSPRLSLGLTTNEGSHEVFVYGQLFEGQVSTQNAAGIQTDLSVTLSAFSLSYTNEQVTFSELMPDTKIPLFIRQFLVLFAANIYYDSKNKVVTLNLINDFEDAPSKNLSKYVQKKTKEVYDLGGYTSINEFKYSLGEDQEDTSKGVLLYGSNEGEKSTHFTSIFSEPVLFNSTNQIHENLLFDEEGNSTEGEFLIGTIQEVNEPLLLTPFDGDYGKSISTYKALDFNSVKFSTLMPKYYNFLADRVFDKPRKVLYDFAMPVVRFMNLNVQELIYLEQEASDFMVSKMKISSLGKVNAELIRVDKRRLVVVDPVAVITGKKLYTENNGAVVILSSKNSYAPSGYITDYYWEVKDENGIVIYTSVKDGISFLLPINLTYEVCLTVTDNKGNQNTKCEGVISSPYVAPVLPPIGKITVVYSDSCVTLIQAAISGTPSTNQTIEVSTTISNGSCLTIISQPATVGLNCIIDSCASLGAINDNGTQSVQIAIDATGMGLIQVAIEGRKDPDSPIANATATTIKDIASGMTVLASQRQWVNTGNC